ncbi:translation elongation factor EF-1 subunit alpha [Pelomyxa schiedti]|nr:translation elongation factor EF-1 subunit alpha [Pelomyxa schiedti]
MDQCNWSQAIFDAFQSLISSMMKQVGHDVTKIHFVPISAQTGENIVKTSGKMDWFRGPTLLQAMQVVQYQRPPMGDQLRIPICAVEKIGGIGTVVIGRVEYGSLRAGDSIHIVPPGITTMAKSIEQFPMDCKQVTPGFFVGVNARACGKSDFKHGDVIVSGGSKPNIVRWFSAQIHVVHSKNGIWAGCEPLCFVHTAVFTGRISGITQCSRSKSTNNQHTVTGILHQGERANVIILPRKRLFIEEYSVHPKLGTLILVENQAVMAVGIVKRVYGTKPRWSEMRVMLIAFCREPPSCPLSHHNLPLEVLQHILTLAWPIRGAPPIQIRISFQL